MSRAGAGLAIAPEKCVSFFEELMKALEDLSVICQIQDGPNNSRTAVSLNLPQAVKVVCYVMSGSLAISLPVLDVGEYEGELAQKIKEELGLQNFGYFGEQQPFLNVDPKVVAKVYVDAANVLGDAMVKIRLVESNLRTLKEKATEAATKKIAVILQAHRV